MERVCLYTGPGSLMREPEDVKILVCLDAVPENMERFVNLVHFSIVGKTEILDCPDVVYDIPTLQHLHVEGKVNLEPFALEDMTHLKSLTVENLEDEDFNILYIGELYNLEYLCIKNTRLALAGLFHMRNNLKHLILRNTDMEFLSRAVYRLWRLRTLDISENVICDVSRRIMDLANLKNFAWSHKTRPDMELVFSVVPDHLPMHFYELMEIDISRKSREDYMSEIYDEEETLPPMMYDDDYSDDEEDAETVFDDFLNVYDSDFDELVPATLVDEGYVSDDGDDEPVLYNPPNQARAEFQLDYIFPDDKRVPDWEYLYDDEDDSDDDSPDFESATNSDADDECETDYDSDYECDYENERI